MDSMHMNNTKVKKYRLSKYVMILKLCLVMCLCTLAAGCNNDSKDKTAEEDKTEQSIGVVMMPTITGIELDDMITLSLYSVDRSCTGIVDITAVIPASDCNPSRIVTEVVSSMEDSAWYISIDEVTTDGSTVIVSFNDSAPPVANVTATQEEVILDAFAQSLLDNLSDYSKVIFRVNNEAYESSNRKYSKDYIYMERK